MKYYRLTAVSTLAMWISLAGCAVDPSKQLERTAKDWCMTIRASQVLPVYPLTEDVQPGDVFLVQTPISTQTDIYKKRGFLALDQLVTRFHALDYRAFYQNGYWTGTYASIAHVRPGWPTPPATAVPVEAPRAAFPSYNFSVQRGVGLQLAIPLHGVPVGLGIMGASRATGSVTINDAYTYGVDSESLLRQLYAWWRSSPDIAETFQEIVKQTNSPVYLRVVTRVYLTGGVVVSLTNLDAVAAGADVGAAPELKLLDLSTEDPEKVEASIAAYKAALEAISGQLNEMQNNAPGGAVRFAQASQRSVTMNQTFDRPLVIGYLGFDVRVYDTGQLSAPIPSYSVLNGYVVDGSFAPIPWGTADDGGLSDLYVEWLILPGNRDKMVTWLRDQGLQDEPEDLPWNDQLLPVLRQADVEFHFSPPPAAEDGS